MKDFVGMLSGLIGIASWFLPNVSTEIKIIIIVGDYWAYYCYYIYENKT